MKIRLNLLVILLFTQSFCVVAQNKKVIVGLKHGSTYFYKNYPNSIELGFQGFCEDDFSIEVICNECDSIKSSEKYNYTIYASKSRSIRLEFFATYGQTDSNVFISATNFYVLPLPDPSVMIGHYFSFQDVKLSDIRNKMFSALYPPDINIGGRFNIDEWRVEIGEKKFKGNGAWFSNELNYYLFNESKAKNFTVEVYLMVSAPDGTEREIYDIFNVYK